MVRVSYEIKSDEGLHARPASDFCAAAAKFTSKITIEKDGEEYDGKSILMVLCVGAVKGDVIEIIADGDDEQAAIDELIKTLDAE